MPAFVVAPFVIGAVVGLAFQWLAFRHLSERGRRDPGRALLLGALIGPDHFTARGWRYRNLSIAAAAVGFLATAVLAFLGTAYGWL